MKLVLRIVFSLCTALILSACAEIDTGRDAVLYGEQATQAVENEFGIKNLAPPPGKRWKKLRCDFSHKAEEGYTAVSVCAAEDKEYIAHLYLLYTEEYTTDAAFFDSIIKRTSRNQVIRWEEQGESFKRTIDGIEVTITVLKGYRGLDPYQPIFSIATFTLNGLDLAVMVGNGAGDDLNNQGKENLPKLREVMEGLTFPRKWTSM